ncbi:hypothetical protein HD806DRAFT_541456 [Xylariaceae sp. AK1471]|nr:hypothetical protein HD806DRAFT_541456 [Xylariaceae sp. AK1471]
MSFAYKFPSEHQEPLIRPPLSQPPPSRRIVLRSSSQPISGSYPLYDLLSISTESGSVSVAVTPHSASEEDPSQPASLELESHSGSVHVTLSEAFVEHHIRSDDATSEPPPPYLSTIEAVDYDDNAKYDIKADIKAGQKNIPEHISRDGSGNTAIGSGVPTREYITSVSTQSGSISGTFPLGSHTALESRSGSLGGIELVVMPINRSGSRRLKTVSRDGMQSVRVVDDDFWAVAKEAWWEGMVSRHESHSGSINVEYPDSWEGTIEVESENGSVSVTGRGVEIIREEKGRVLARKGKEGGGKVIVRARSGSVSLRFG